MNKFLLSLAALALSVSALNAQGLVKKGDYRFERVQKSELKTLDKAKIAPSAIQKVTVADNERILGFYDTDDLPLEGIGVPNYASGTLKAGSELPTSISDRFAGDKLVRLRFALSKYFTDGVTRAWVGMVTGNSITEVATVDLTSAKSGWNEVTLSEPVTLQAGTSYVLGFDYNQKRTNNGYQYNEECFPLCSDEASDGSILMYGNLGQGTGWYNLGGGNLCIQGVVQGDNFADYDLILSSVISSLSAPQFAYVNAGKDLDYTFTIKAVTGSKVPQSYSLEVSVDGKKVETLTSPVTVSNTAYKTVSGKIPTTGIAIGRHELSVKVVDINGAAPDASTTADDELKGGAFSVYDASAAIPHTKSLIEHFTSQYCTYCPYGYDILNKMMEMRDDLAWVSVHGDMSSAQRDAYTIDDSQYILGFACAGFPGAAFNRYWVDDTSINDAGYLGVSIGYGSAYANKFAQMLSSVVDDSNELPAFVNVDIATTLDKNAKKLDIKVSGKDIANFKSVMGEDAVLTVYLTENGLVSKQLNNGTWIAKFTHNHVLRDVVTSPLGDAINWNGDTYENDYTVTLDANWNADDMEVVAFVSRPITLSGNTFTSSPKDAIVNQVNSVKAGESVTTGIKNVTNAAAEDGVEVARYSVDGTQLTAPVKGLNIVKLSNGKTVKVLVK